MSVEKRAFLFAGAGLCVPVQTARPTIDTIRHKSLIVRLSSIFAPRVKEKISVGFFFFSRLGCRETNCKSRECQACKETLDDTLCSHGRPFNYGLGYEKVNSWLSVMGFFFSPSEHYNSSTSFIKQQSRFCACQCFVLLTFNLTGDLL